MKKTGIELIAAERQEQIEKHGYRVSISCRHDYNYKILFDHTAVSVCSKCKKRVKA